MTGNARATGGDAATLALLCVAQFVVVLDGTIVAVALPAIRDDLGFGSASLQWVLSAFGVTFGGLLLAAGRLADRHGRRRLFVAGLLVFGAASPACALAPSPVALVAARAVQGAGAAAVAPSALALLGAAFPEGRARARAVALWTAAAAGGGASGWVLGGVLTQRLGWPAVFLVVVPVAVAGAAVAPRVLQESRDDDAAPVDAVGALLGTAGIALALLALSRAEAHATDPLTLGAAAGAALLLAAFTVRERHARSPLVPPELLRRGRLPAPAAAAAALTAATTPPIFVCVLLLQAAGHDALHTGLAFVPFNLAVVAGSLAAPRIVRRFGARGATSAGLVGVAGGVVALLAATWQGPPASPALAAALVLLGASLGSASVASTDAGTAAAGLRRGAASAILTAAAQLGTAAGLAVLVPLGTAAAQVARRSGASSTDALAAGARWTCAAAALVALAAAAVTRALDRSPAHRATCRALSASDSGGRTR